MASTSLLLQGKVALRDLSPHPPPSAEALHHPLQPERLGLDSQLCPPEVGAEPSQGAQMAPTSARPCGLGSGGGGPGRQPSSAQHPSAGRCP